MHKPLVAGAEKHPNRNFLIFVINTVLERIGWIFKTDSIVIPGFVDTYTGSGAIRGFLPLIFQLGLSLPPFLIAHRLAKMPRKRPLFIIAGCGVMLPWFVLALILRFTRWSARQIIAAFLVLYTLHWFCYGCYLLAAGTLHGKLIIAERRGRLLAFSFVFGCGFAIVTAYFVMSAWLTSGDARYDSIFVAAGVFAGAAISVVFFLKEPPSPPLKDQPPFSKFIGDGLLLLLTDRNFRRLAGVMVLASTLWILFPHYTVFGKQRLGLESPNFIALIIAQNAGHGTGALVMGPIADRYGNRIVLRMLISVAGAVPLLAIAFSRLAFGAEIYWLMYAFLGFTFVIVRIFINYTLEIAPLEKHPQYLGVLSLFQSVPLFVSPLLGLLIDQFSFEPIFIGVSALTFGGAVLTFGLDEPRGQPID